MKVFTEIRAIREHIQTERFAAAGKGQNLTVGLVPTMGYLHDGHASLLHKARQISDLVVLSIFVNPIQFGPNEDYDRYPRDAEKDLALAEREGVDVVFMPSAQEMYPEPIRTKIKVEELTERLCGASRPGHFDGVTTVVGKLFHIVQPDQAFFGQKDAQQVAVIKQMVKDLNFGIDIIPCPIVREADGLALSSRNVYLTPEQRQAALVLSKSLHFVEEKAKSVGGVIVGDIRSDLIDTISSEPLAEIDYVEITKFPDLTALEDPDRLDSIGSDVLIALAVKFGSTRLIDNVILEKKVLTSC
ncbi:pantoate--beta-alanine ligase [Paenibacillus puldeungensis]|uniref:Pantothenate synthetase n=1 Tax=Paenibacillus puldeungensis TaxID=696536 RepID=A0ABW3S465_9BACL